MPEILRPELIDLTDAEVEAVSGGQTARAGNGGAGGAGGSLSFTLGGAGNGGAGRNGGNATANDTTPPPPPR